MPNADLKDFELRRRVWAAPEQYKTRPEIWHRYLGFINGGYAMEFGVWNGRSVNYMADVRPDTAFFAFDSFEGLPEAWIKGHPAGHFKTNLDALKFRTNVRPWKGWFSDTIPVFLKSKPKGRLQGVHIDCDLGSSTRDILYGLKEVLTQDKPVLLFDEFYNYEGYEQHEFKAFLDWTNEFKVDFEVIARNIRHQQTIIVLK